MKKREKERIAYQRLHTLGEGTPNYMKSLTRQIRTIFKQTTTNKEEKKSPERKKRSKSPKQNTSEVKIHIPKPKELSHLDSLSSSYSKKKLDTEFTDPPNQHPIIPLKQLKDLLNNNTLNITNFSLLDPSLQVGISEDSSINDKQYNSLNERKKIIEEKLSVVSRKMIFKELASDLALFGNMTKHIQFDDYKDKLSHSKKLHNIVEKLKMKYSSKGYALFEGIAKEIQNNSMRIFNIREQKIRTLVDYAYQKHYKQRDNEELDLPNENIITQYVYIYIYI